MFLYPPPLPPLQVREAEAELAGERSERQARVAEAQSTEPLLHGETGGDPGTEVATGEALLEQVHGPSEPQHRYNYGQ